MVKLLVEIFKNRILLLKMVKIDIATKHAGQVLGKGWLIFSPLAFLTIYAVIYTYVFKITPTGYSTTQYVLYIFCGLIPYMSFAECLQQSSVSIKSNESILKNLTFPLIIVPVKTVMVSHINLLVSLTILLIASSFLGIIGWCALLLPVVIILQLFFLTGLGLIASLITVGFKDFSQIITYFNMLLMVASPIAYTPEMVPSKLRFLLWLNPLTYFIELYRSIALFNSLPEIRTLISAIVASALSLALGSYIFNKIRKVIINYV